MQQLITWWVVTSERVFGGHVGTKLCHFRWSQHFPKSSHSNHNPSQLDCTWPSIGSHWKRRDFHFPTTRVGKLFPSKPTSFTQLGIAKARGNWKRKIPISFEPIGPKGLIRANLVQLGLTENYDSWNLKNKLDIKLHLEGFFIYLFIIFLLYIYINCI